MAHIFIALENPQSMLGYTKKAENFPKAFTKPKFSFETKEPLTRGEREQKAKRQEEKYAARKAYIDKKDEDPFSVDGTRTADRAVAEEFCRLPGDLDEDDDLVQGTRGLHISHSRLSRPWKYRRHGRRLGSRAL